MRNWWRPTAQLILLLSLANAGQCLADTLSLSEWLEIANRQGIRIIYSSALVHSRFKVTVDPEAPVSLEAIRRVLHSFDLALKAAGRDGWVVVKKRLPPPESPILKQPARVTAPRMEVVVVISSRYRLLLDQSPGLSVLDHAEIDARPTIANDALRAVNQLPGNANAGLSVKPRVRGGNEDETLFLFNGIRLYEPFHLAAFNNLFSTIDGRIIESLDFYSGGFPVQFGDRLSGVVSVTSTSPAALGDVREVGAGLYNVSYLQAGKGAGGRYLVDIRRSNLELLRKVSETDFGYPRFSDVYARHDYSFANGAQLSTNFLWYGDKISLNNSSHTEFAEALYSNTWLWWNLEQDLGDSGGYSRTRLAIAGINSDRAGNIATPSIISGFLDEKRELRVYNIAQDVTLPLSDDWLLETGLDWRHLQGEYEHRRQTNLAQPFAGVSNIDGSVNEETMLDRSGQQVALYARLKWAVTKAVTADIGLRGDGQNYIDGWTRQLSPRFNLMYEPGRSTQLRLAWGKFAQSQGMHELDLADGIERFKRPEKSIHQIVSLTHRFSDVDLRLELYRKRGIDAGYYFENLTNPLTLVPELQFDRIRVQPDDFEAKGAELSLTGKTNSISWWMNYSWSEARDRVDGRNIERSWDQTHGANVGVNFDLAAWSVSITGQYHTGWPTTALNLDPAGNVVPGPRNSIRFDHYMSWDVKFRREWPLGHDRSLRLEAGLTNIFNRDNQVGIEYEFKGDTLVANEQYALGVAPFLDLYWRF